FRLARAPQSITVVDVVQAIDGPEPAFRCTEIRQRGPAGLEPSAYPLLCAIHATMRRAEHAWREVLRGQTLADLAGLVAEPIAFLCSTMEAEAQVRRFAEAGRRGISLRMGNFYGR